MNTFFFLKHHQLLNVQISVTWPNNILSSSTVPSSVHLYFVRFTPSLFFILCNLSATVTFFPLISLLQSTPNTVDKVIFLVHHWSCQVMSQSLRWFSISLYYKVKFLLCNFKALQESALTYHWTKSLLFPSSDTVLPTVCIHISCMTSYFYSQNWFQCLKYPPCSILPNNLIFHFQVSLCILCKFGYVCFGATVLFLKTQDICEVAGVTMTLKK